MDMVKGFRFHPTDQELIEYLQIKTFDRDSVVQVIDEVQDICESEPWELAGRSALQTGDRLWYFMYPPKYKYRNSKRISRTTLEGYWKPTGNARKIINYDNGEEIGSKKTLVFYKGQCNDKNKNKTCWVMHEYELKADPKASDSDQELLDPKGSSEPEASNGSDIVHNKSSSIETFAGERSNQHNISNYMHHVAEDAIPKEPLHVIEVSTEKNGPEDSNRVQKPYSTIEQDNESCNSILTNDGETVPIERSNQHNIVVAVESFEMPTNFEFLADEDLIPTDLFYNYGISLDELLAEPKATNNSNWIQNHSITNIEDEFLDSIFADNNEAYLQEEDRRQCLAAENGALGLPCIGVMESSDSMGKSRKRPRLEYDGLNHHVETGEA
ncbi:protein FEZ-like isoform X2 [Durio zibethinus]|uniref:Protein FEZ-like isoform X2 n=1 Tax=Durio zibethinus TaxID=66656 RepID=A0A6P6A1R5_DURZI|nr:protein FEZ-like isoform X2 [Durio zibethinus]